jgi:hypothetical protein
MSSHDCLNGYKPAPSHCLVPVGAVVGARIVKRATGPAEDLRICSVHGRLDDRQQDADADTADRLLVGGGQAQPHEQAAQLRSQWAVLRVLRESRNGRRDRAARSDALLKAVVQCEGSEEA